MGQVIGIVFNQRVASYYSRSLACCSSSDEVKRKEDIALKLLSSASTVDLEDETKRSAENGIRDLPYSVLRYSTMAVASSMGARGVTGMNGP